MSKFNLFGLMLLAAMAFTVGASDKPITPVGVFQVIQNTEDDDEANETVVATLTRDGEKGIPIETGMEVYPDDIVSTNAKGSLAVAYIQGYTVTLQESTQLTVGAASPEGVFKASSFTLNDGHATAVASTRSFDFAIGDNHNPVARASTAVKLDLIVTKDPATGVYTTHVAVLNGTVTLTANGSSVDVITGGTQAIMTINTKTDPLPSVTAVNKGNIGKDALKGLKVGNFTETLVTQGKTGFSFKSTIKNGDGSISKGSFVTLFAGNLTKDTWKTSNKADKSSTSWSQDIIKQKLGVKIAFTDAASAVKQSFSAAFAGNTASKASVKSGKNTYKGTATYNPANGLITFVTTTPAKDGSTATFTYDPRDPAKQVQTVVITPTGGGAAITSTHNIITGPPPANIPKGNLIEQSMPPKSQ